MNVWQLQRPYQVSKLAILLCIMMQFSICLKAQSPMRLIMKKNTEGPYLKIGDIGSDFPCGNRFGITLEDNRYFFCKKSSMNATMAPDSINFLLSNGNIIDADGNIIAPKTEFIPPNENFNSYSQEAIINRVNTINIGTYQTDSGSRMGIWSKDLKEYYADHTFEIVLDGKEQTAFNPETLIYELLVTTQQQYEEIALLKLRLGQVENKVGISNNANSKNNNYIKIIVNPIQSNELEFEYQISQNVDNAYIVLSTLSGKTLRTIPFKNRGLGIDNIYLDLIEGLYLATMIIDGNVLDTEKFIVQ